MDVIVRLEGTRFVMMELALQPIVLRISASRLTRDSVAVPTAHLAELDSARLVIRRVQRVAIVGPVKERALREPV